MEISQINYKGIQSYECALSAEFFCDLIIGKSQPPMALSSISSHCLETCP